MPVASPFEMRAGPLRLRRPTPDDLDAYVRLHTDPRTYSHAPQSMPDEAGCRDRLAADLEDWRTLGFGYVAVEEIATGRVVGWGGVRQEQGRREALNLYYRFEHDALGRGYGRRLARAVTVAATEALPGRRVCAVIRPVNVASQRTAVAAGLLEVGTVRHPHDRPDEPESLLFELPRVERVPGLDDDLRKRLLDLWQRVVNEGGGAVGFLPGVRREEIVPVLGAHERAMEAGTSMLAVLRAPGGDLLGFGWWQGSADLRFRHVAKLMRFQVDPAHQGRNLGAVLLAGMHAIARDLPGVELLRLDYRSGVGLGAFYGQAGWVETGRSSTGATTTRSLADGRGRRPRRRADDAPGRRRLARRRRAALTRVGSDVGGL